MARRLGDLLAAHIGDLIDLLAKFGRIGIERGELAHEDVDPLVELALLALVDRHEAGGLLGRHHGHRIGRRQVEFDVGLGFGGAVVAIIVSLPVLY